MTYTAIFYWVIVSGGGRYFLEGYHSVCVFTGVPLRELISSTWQPACEQAPSSTLPWLDGPRWKVLQQLRNHLGLEAAIASDRMWVTRKLGVGLA